MAFYKRSVFLVNPPFQIKFSLIVSSLFVLSSLIYPIILLDFFDEVAILNPNLQGNVFDARNDLILFLMGIQGLFIFMVFIIFIFLTHKVAGPLYKLKMHLYDIRQGGKIAPLTFRGGDHFQDVAEEVTLFLETMTMNQENDFEYIEEVATYLQNLETVIPDDKKPVLREISRRLMDIKSRYKKDL